MEAGRKSKCILATVLLSASFGSLGPAGAQGPPQPGCPAPSGSGQCSVTVDISGDLGGGGIRVSGFTPLSQVRFEIFASPGGSLLIPAVTKTTDDSGGSFFSFDGLAPGQRVIVTDVATSVVKTVDVALLRIDSVDLVADTVTGTAAPNSSLNVGLSGPGIGMQGGLSVQADAAGAWTADFTTASTDITFLNDVFAVVPDDDGDQTRGGPRPGCPAVHPGRTCRIDIAARGGGGDQITVLGFTPDSTVTIEVFDGVGGPSVYGPFTRQTGSNGFQGHHSSIDLRPDHHVVVTDDSTGVVKSLLVQSLAIESVDPVADTVSGIASPGAHVWVGLFGSPAVESVADSQGNWTAVFSGDPSVGGDVGTAGSPTAMIFDEDIDATLASIEPGCPAQGFVCVVGSQLEHDSIGTFGFEPNSEVLFEVFEGPGGSLLAGPISRMTNEVGSASIDFGLNPGPDLVAGMYVEVTDVASGVVKGLELSDLSIDVVDPVTDIVEGRGPPGALIGVEANGAPRHLEVNADVTGFWRADFGVEGYDIDSISWFLSSVSDPDGDFTGDSLGSPIEGCIDDADTACGSAGPDTIREDDGEVISGPEDDTALIDADESTDEIDVDLGPGDDGTAIDPSKRHRFLSSLFSSAATLLPVTIRGGTGSDRVLLPTHATDLVIKVFGGAGNDSVELRALGGGKLAIKGRYTLVGGGGNDELRGADGDDILEGGAGTDKLYGGKGFDICYATGDDQTFSCEKVVHKRHR